MKGPVTRKWFSDHVKKGNRVCGLRRVKKWKDTEKSYVDCCKRGGVVFEYGDLNLEEKTERQEPETSYSEEGQTLGDGRGLVWNGKQYVYGNFFVGLLLIVIE